LEASDLAHLAVVIPVYNESGNILETLDSLYEKVQTPKTVYLIYDFDEDSTLPPVKKNLSRYPGLSFIKNKYGKGALNAIKTGLEETGEDAVLVTMADGSDDYAAVDQMYQKIKKGAAVVAGSRYMRGGRQIGGPFIKGSLSRLAGLSAYYLSGIGTHDLSNSFRMYKRDLLDKIKIESTGGFELATELTVKAYLAGYKVDEVPTTWVDRAEGKSRFKLFKWLPGYLKWYLRLLFSLPHKIPRS